MTNGILPTNLAQCFAWGFLDHLACVRFVCRGICHFHRVHNRYCLVRVKQGCNRFICNRSLSHLGIVLSAWL